MVVGKWPPTIWIVWGFLGLLGSAALGAGILRRELNGVAAGGDSRVAASRMARIAAINLTLLVSVVAAMVFKPTLG